MRTAWSGFDRAVAEGDQEAYTATTSRRLTTSPMLHGICGFVSYKIEFARTFEEDEVTTYPILRCSTYSCMTSGLCNH